MRESAIESPTVKTAKLDGWIVRKVKWIGRRGAPDRYFTKWGYTPRFIEFKAPGKPLKPHQKREIKKLRAAGTIVYVVDSLLKARKALEVKIVKPQRP